MEIATKKQKPRFCRFCGIGIGEKNSPPKSWGVGLVCKVCTKYMNREKALKYYHTSDIKARRCKEPEKKECSECKKTFWSAISFKVTCGDECARVRKNRLQKNRYLK